jgi:hypothetical protein
MYSKNDESTISQIKPKRCLETLVTTIKLKYFGHIDSMGKDLMGVLTDVSRGRQRTRWKGGLLGTITIK